MRKLVTLILSIITYTSYAQLSGTYTIGGVSPDYSDLSTAVADLNLNGITSPVTFDIRDGIYNEQVSIEEIVGASATNTITFQSENRDSSLVTLQYTNTSGNNYIIRLDGADYVTIRDLHFQALSTSYSDLLVLQGGASYNRLKNCYLQGDINSGRLVYSNTDVDENNHFTNNFFYQGQYGLYYRGTNNSNLESGTLIENNRLENQYYDGIYVAYQDAVTVRNNEIGGTTTINGNSGISLYYGNNGGQVTNNTIISDYKSYGLYLYQCLATTGNHMLVANNVISLGYTGTATGSGIYQYYSTYLDIYYNSIAVQTSNASNTAFLNYYGNNIDFRNNSFANFGPGYSINNLSTANIVFADNNNLYTAGNALALVANVPQNTLADWETTTGGSLNKNANPLYATSDDLTPNHTFLDGGGTPLAAVTTDINGTARNFPPDIGAYEFTATGDNAGLTALEYPLAPFATGSYLLKATLENAGPSTLSTADIHWEINGVAQPTVNWSGNLSEAQTEQVDLGNYTFNPITRYDLKVWVTAPNGNTDTNTADDTLAVQRIYTTFSGNYTIGGTAPDFATFSLAGEALNYGGLNAAATFNFRDGIYTDQVSLGEIYNNDATNSITFQSESADSSAVTIQFDSPSSDNYILRLQGTDFVTLRNLGFKTLDVSYADILVLEDGATDLTVENNYFEGDFNSGRLIYSVGDQDNNTVIRNNYFWKGTDAIYLRGLSNADETGLVIENNAFLDNYTEAINIAYAQAAIIRNNDINKSIVSSSYTIYLSRCDGAMEITNNKLITNNYYGLYLDNCDATIGNEGLIANNFISLRNTDNTTAYGIYEYYSDHQKIYHNSIQIHSNHASSGRAFYSVNGSNLDLKNNIIANLGVGFAIYTNGTTSILSADHNDLYTNGAVLGYWQGNTNTLADWQAASGRDQNSVSTDPLFAAADDYLVNAALLNGGGTTLATVPTDLDGVTRGTPPDIGAIEFTPVGENAGLTALSYPAAPFDPAIYPISTSLLNGGASDLTSADIYWEINGVAQTTINWTGTLSTSLTTEVALGNYDFQPNIRYELRAWVANPNSGTDIDASNDTLVIENIFTTIGGQLTIGGTTPNFPDFSTAADALNHGGLNAAVTFLVRDGIYEEQFSLGEIYNNDATNSITYQSEATDSSAVTLQFTSSSSMNYLVLLNGTDYVSFRNLSFKTLHTSYANGIRFNDGTDNLLVENCHFEGDLNSGTLLYSEAAEVDNNTVIRNNYFYRGSDAIYLRGQSSSQQETGLIIENNVFEETYTEAIYVQQQVAPSIIQNQITDTNGSNGAFKVRLQRCDDGLRFIANKIISATAFYGLYVESSVATPGNEGLIANNFISLKNTATTGYGIYRYTNSYLNIYYNSVQVQANHATNSRTYYGYYGDNIQLKNNIFSNLGGGYALYETTTGALSDSDFNDYYTTGPNLAYYASTQTTLADLQTASGFEANSININPLFNSADDLHISLIALQAATPIAGIIIDIDGDNRNPVSPYIGADETPSASDDAGLTSFDGPNMPFPTGQNDVEVSLVNNFAANLNSVNFHWEVNGAQQPDFAWSGNIPSGDQLSINIGNFPFEVATAYDIKVWISNPNGVNDIFAVNDTIAVNDLYAALSGTYTIGGMNPDFADFTSAAAALQNGGVVGPVTFEVADGTYDEQIALTTIMGGGASNPIVFQSASNDRTAVTLSYDASSSNNYLVSLNNVSYLTFQNMSLSATDPTYARVFHLQGNNSHLNVLNNIISGDGTPANSNGDLIYAASSKTEYFVAENNLFLDGATAILLNNNSGMAQGNRIENNTFTNQRYYGIYLARQDGPKIRGNTISTNYANSNDGIYLYIVDNALEISKNKINIATGRYGISLNSCDGTAGNYQLIANNFITIGGTNSTYGLSVSSCTYQKYYFNSVNVLSNEPTDGRAFYLTSGGNIQLQNNILANSGGGYAIYINTISALPISDHNDLYSNGGTLGYWSGNRTSLAAWQGASGKDANSISVDPLFTAADDLHVTQQNLSEAGTPVAEITTDIDNEQRNPLTPDIGADEFTNLQNNLAVESLLHPSSGCDLPSQDSVVISIRNAGSDPQTGFNVAYQIDNNPPVVENVGALNIAGGAIAEYVFTTPIDLSADGDYTVKVYTLLATDELNENDSIITTISSFPAQEPVVVSPDLELCQGLGVTLQASGGTSYAWSNGSNNSSTYVAPQATTTYFVDVTNENGCTETGQVTVTVLPKPSIPTISYDGSNTICFGDTLELTSSITDNITWTTGDTTATIKVASSGYYRVTHTSPDGCEAISSNTYVSVLAEPSISAAPFASVCFGESVTLSVNNASSYNWSTGETTSSILVSPTDTTEYYVNGVNSAGCAYIDTIQVNILPAVSPGSISNLLPADGSFELDLPITFSWSPAPNASHYDVFIWEQGQPKPANPAINNATAINSSYSNLSYGKSYNWQVVAENSCSQTFGDTLMFSVRHLPDLIVSEVQIPDDIPSAGDLQVTWKVKNQGLGSSQAQTWKDRIFLSIDQVQGGADDIQLGVYNNLNYLNAGQEYEQTQNITLPDDAIGYFYLYVKSDTYNNLKELNESNNSKEDTLLIFPAPLPDLRMYSVGGPNIAFGKDTISVTYTVKNEGNRTLMDETWKDGIFLLRDSAELINSLAIQLGTDQTVSMTLAPDSTYTRTVTGAIPHTAFGDYYVMGFTDRNDVIEEYTRESNNLIARENLLEVVLRPPADLAPTNFFLPVSAKSGEPVLLGWEVTNSGPNPPCESYWIDRIYISKLDTFNLDSAIYMGQSYKYNGTSLQANDSYQLNGSHTLPEGISGYYYLYVFTDYTERVFEYTAEDNNLARSPGTFLVDLAPYPDLTTTSITVPDTLVAGYPFLNQWTVANLGTGPMTQPLHDYWSIWPSNGFIGEKYTADDIPAGNSLNLSSTMTVPVELGAGDYELRIKNDLYNYIYEYIYKDNNTAVQPVYVREPVSDLVAADLTVPTVILAGVEFEVTAEMRNDGPELTDEKRWYNGIYLSQDTIWDASDVRIKSREYTGAMYPNDVRQHLINQILIPESDTGSYYMLFYTDYSEFLEEDTDLTNNVYAVPVEVLPAPDADLAPISLTYPSTIYAGQQISISYTISNLGTEPPVVLPWHNDLILSASPNATTGLRTTLRRSARSITVSGGGDYTVTSTVTIPPYFIGNFYFVVKSDIYDVVFEYGNESNNTFAELIEILPPPATDLLVTTVDVPATIIPGQDITVNYTVKNEGAEPAVGLLRDALHMSTDGVFDGAADPFVGLQDRNVLLQPGDSLVSTFTREFPAVLPGTYNGIGRTNTLNQIPEIDLTNNDKLSNNTIDVLIPSLVLDVVEPNIPIDFEDNIYYQVNVAADLDLLVTLTSNQIEGINEVYVAYGRVPTPNDFDYQFLDPNQVDQRVLVPQTQAGNYYILVRCLSNHLGNQRVDLLAEALPFSLVSIQSNVVGQGRVTCMLNGAGFRDSTIITLEDAMGMVVDTATVRTFISSMQLRIRWELGDVPLGLYDVVATNANGDRVVLVDGLTVEELYREVGYDVVGPEVVRAGTANPYSVVFENIGNVDVDYFAARVTTVNVPFYFIETIGSLTKTTDIHPIGDDIIVNDDILGSGLTAHIGPLLGRDMMPGQIYQANIQVGRFTIPEFTLSVGVESFTTEEFLARHDESLMAIYDDVIANPGNYHSDVVALAAAGYGTMHDFYVQFLVDNLLLDPYEVSGNGFVGGPVDNRLFHESANYANRRMNSTACDIGGYSAGTATFATCAAITLAAGITGPGAIAIGFGCFTLNYWVIIPNYKDWCNDVIAGGDPNEIAGPVGYGTEQWVSVDDRLDYTIFFENDPDLATAAAQRVNIVEELDPNADPYSFRLSGFGFAGMTFDVPANRLSYTKLLDLPDSLGYDVQLTAGLNVSNNTIFWEFQTLDPNTGLPPADPFVGFLPINDSTGIGEGFVYYSIKPKNTAVTGDSLQAEATIIFGVNDEIKTNIWTNFIDALPPTSAVSALPAVVIDPNILIDMSGNDDTGGVGIDYYALYASQDNGPYLLVADSLYNTTYPFTGMTGSTYDFFSLGTDYVGNTEAWKMSPDATTTIARNRSLDLKVYLESAFVNTNEQSINLNNAGLIPLAQPYSAAPWNYPGTETLSSLPADMVDWVLVTLRRETDANTSVDTLAGILLLNGQIVGADGQDLAVARDLDAVNELYITVLHRNHIEVMSATKITQVDDVFTYDFTTMPAYGTNAMRTMGTGDFVLYAGDANGDGIVDAADRSAAWNNRNQTGYIGADVTVDGQVDAGDRSLTWNNRNKGRQVP